MKSTKNHLIRDLKLAFIFWILFAGIILWIGNYTNIDLVLADWFYDFENEIFPWRKSWLASTFMHEWLKTILVSTALIIIGLALIDCWKPMLSKYSRIRLRIVAIAAISIPLVIGVLKRLSFSHCPWDLERYNGFAPYIRLLDTAPSFYKAGHCMPAGHASASLWLSAFAVFWLPYKPKTALLVATIGLLIGFFFGWFQQMRGAHFLTHTLWSVWIAGVLLSLLIALFMKRLD